MPAKISANVLKHGRKTRSVLRQDSLHLQKYKAARMSRRTAIDQKVCGWDGRQPVLTVWNLPNYTRIENAHEVRKNIFVFFYVAVVCTITKGKEKIRACVSRYDQTVWNANQWPSSKQSTHYKHRCATVLAQKTKRGSSDASWNQMRQLLGQFWNLAQFELSVHNYFQCWWLKNTSFFLRSPLTKQ